MSEEEAREKARALALCMGITVYVVRSPGGDCSLVQNPTADVDIVETVLPPENALGPDHSGTLTDHGDGDEERLAC